MRVALAVCLIIAGVTVPTFAASARAVKGNSAPFRFTATPFTNAPEALERVASVVRLDASTQRVGIYLGYCTLPPSHRRAALTVITVTHARGAVFRVGDIVMTGVQVIDGSRVLAIRIFSKSDQFVRRWCRGA